MRDKNLKIHMWTKRAIIIIVVIFFISGCGKKPGRPIITEAMRKVIGEKGTLLREKNIKDMKEREEAEEKELIKDLEILKTKNPFSARPFARGGDAVLVLRGIVWDEINPTAMINDQIVSVGDMIGTKEVKEINVDSVILLDGDKELKLQLEFE